MCENRLYYMYVQREIRYLPVDSVQAPSRMTMFVIQYILQYPMICKRAGECPDRIVQRRMLIETVAVNAADKDIFLRCGSHVGGCNICYSLVTLSHKCYTCQIAL